MGMLIPPRAEFHREYMFIRSLNELSGVDLDNPKISILKARAYHHLHRRPAALAVIKNNHTADADFLKEIINGNLPNAEMAFKNLQPSMNRFFAALEYSWLMYEYTNRHSKELITQLKEQFPQWHFFIDIILNDQNSWDVPSNVELKQVLDQFYSVPGFSLKDILNEAEKDRDQDFFDLRLNMVTKLFAGNEEMINLAREKAKRNRK